MFYSLVGLICEIWFQQLENKIHNYLKFVLPHVILDPNNFQDGWLALLKLKNHQYTV